MAERALGEHGRPRDHVVARLEVAERLAVLAAAAVAGADPTHDPVLDQQLVGDRLGEDVGALLLGLLGEEARQLRRPRSRSCRGCGSSAASASAAAPRAWSAGRRRPWSPPGRRTASPRASRSGNSSRIAEGFMLAPLRACGRRRPCPSRSPRPGPRRASRSSSGSSASRSMSRFAQASPAGPPPTIATPTSIRSSSGSVGSAISSAGVEGRRVVRGLYGRHRLVSRPSWP